MSARQWLRIWAAVAVRGFFMRSDSKLQAGEEYHTAARKRMAGSAWEEVGVEYLSGQGWP